METHCYDEGSGGKVLTVVVIDFYESMRKSEAMQVAAGSSLLLDFFRLLNSQGGSRYLSKGGVDS